MIPQKIFKHLLYDKPNFDVLFGHSLGRPIRHVKLAAAISTLSRTDDQELRILEIGSWTGSSAFTIAEAIKTFHPKARATVVCIDPWEDYEVYPNPPFLDSYHFGLASDLVYRLFLHNISYIQTAAIQPIRGLSKNILPLLKENYFDLIFIDGDHAYEQCLNDIAYSKKLIKESGIICGDDMELSLEECDIEFARKNSHASNIQDPKTGCYFHPGVTIAVQEHFKNFTNEHGLWLVRREKQDFYPVNLMNTPNIIPSHFPHNIRSSLELQLSV